MKYVPGPSSPAIGATDRWAANSLVKPVQGRTLPPLLPQPQPAQPESPPGPIEETEKRHRRLYQEDRRTYCRRILHLPILEEFRFGVDQRRHNLRRGDITDHIDEKA